MQQRVDELLKDIHRLNFDKDENGILIKDLQKKN